VLVLSGGGGFCKAVGSIINGNMAGIEKTGRGGGVQNNSNELGNMGTHQKGT